MSRDALATFVSTTNLEEISPLSPAGQPVYRSYEVLELEISGRLSSEHAALFAEPQVSETDSIVDWYGSAGSYKRLSGLPSEQQKAVRQTLAGLFDDLTALSLRLGQSAAGEERVLARLLDQALRIPSEESIYVGSHGRPLLTDWGTVTRGAPTESHVLRLLRDQWETAEQKAAVVAVAPPPIQIINQHPVSDGARESVIIPDWLKVAALIMTLLFAILIGKLLLSACGVAWPWSASGGSGLPLIWFCDDQSRRDDALLDLIDSYEREIDERCDITHGALAPDAEPTAPADEGIDAYLTLVNLQPAIGVMCPIAICSAPSSGTTNSSEECMLQMDWADEARADVPDGQCRHFLYPSEFTVESGTSFTARSELHVGDELYLSWPVEGVTYDADLLGALERNGRPRLYWVADFPWPPTDTETD